MPTSATACQSGIHVATLSAFIDGALPTMRATRLRAHIATCTACQGQLADLSSVGNLLRRPAPSLESTTYQQRRTWLAVRTRITRPQRRFTFTMAISRAKLWQSAGVALAVVLIATLTWQFVAHGARRTAASHLSLTPTATPQLPAPAQVWGAQYIHQVTPDNAGFNLYTIAPDGSFAVGNLTNQSGTLASAITTMNLTNGKVQTIYSLTGGNIGNAFTDGRYIAWPVQLNANVAEWQIMAFDGTTQHITTVAHGTPLVSDPTLGYQVLTVWGVEHGYLLWTYNGKQDSDISLYVMNLATGQQTTIATQLGGIASNGQFVWPSVLYADQYANLHVYDIPGARNDVLPSCNCGSLLLTKSAIYGVLAIVRKGVTYQQALVLSGTNLSKASWQVLRNFAGSGIPQVNGRLAVWTEAHDQLNGTQSLTTYIWDFTLQRLMAMPGTVNQFGLGGLLGSRWFVYPTFTSENAPPVYNFIDTSRLPTK